MGLGPDLAAELRGASESVAAWEDRRRAAPARARRWANLIAADLGQTGPTSDRSSGGSRATGWPDSARRAAYRESEARLRSDELVSPARGAAPTPAVTMIESVRIQAAVPVTPEGAAEVWQRVWREVRESSDANAGDDTWAAALFATRLVEAFPGARVEHGGDLPSPLILVRCDEPGEAAYMVFFAPCGGSPVLGPPISQVFPGAASLGVATTREVCIRRPALVARRSDIEGRSLDRHRSSELAAYVPIVLEQALLERWRGSSR